MISLERSCGGVLGALGRDPHCQEGRHRRPCRRLRRANRSLHPLYKAPSGPGDCVALLVPRGWRSTPEATALSTPRARHGDLPLPESPAGGDLKGAPGEARFPPRRRAFTLRSTGAVRLGALRSRHHPPSPVRDGIRQGAPSPRRATACRICDFPPRRSPSI
jgi:hypothetical protein